MRVNKALPVTLALLGSLTTLLWATPALAECPMGTACPMDAMEKPCPMGKPGFKMPQLMSVQGTAETKVPPDSLQVVVTVESTAPKLAEAQQTNNQAMGRVISAIKGQKIPKLTLKTQNLSIYPMQDYDAQRKGKLPKTIGYRVTNQVSVTVEGAEVQALPGYGTQIVDSAVAAGANTVGDLRFYVSNPRDFERQVLARAVEDARKTAEAMAQAAGVYISGVQSIDSSNVAQPYYPTYARAMKAESMAMDAAPTPMEAGESTMSGTVTVRFKFE